MENKYCVYCKAIIQEFDKFRKTKKGFYHDNDINDCYTLAHGDYEEYEE